MRNTKKIPLIGIDFDNTLAIYDSIFHREALQKKWIASICPKNKKTIRDSIRRLPEGERRWQALQGIVYGEKMIHASFPSGASQFLKACREQNIPTVIVSHKTLHPHGNPKIHLHQQALQWMESMGFFDISGINFSKKHIFFEKTREDKIGRIKTLGCTHFIDDLEEVFHEKNFPVDVTKILYRPFMDTSNPPDLTPYSWEGIHERFFSH